jgi:hypothetical protein
MDPYLEGGYWPDFHHDLATEIKRQLLPRLQPRYYAATSTYFLVDTGEDVEISQGVYPDVGVTEVASEGLGRSTAIAEPPVRARLVLPHPMPHSQVEIRDLQDHRLVTAIEFLSPTNKRGLGRKQYLRKRLQILHSTAHLLELDLLRQGRRLPWSGKPPAASYYLYLSRADKRQDIGIWPIDLAAPLPVVPVPLLHPDPDVPLDLQQAVAAVYDASHYELLLNYGAEPDVPLPAAQANWADRLLREKGLRPR